MHDKWVVRMQMIPGLGKLVQAIKTKNMLIQRAQQAATCTQRRIKEISEMVPPFYSHGACKWIKSRMAWGAHPAQFNWQMRNTFSAVLRCNVQTGCYATSQKVSSPLRYVSVLRAAKCYRNPDLF